MFFLLWRGWAYAEHSEGLSEAALAKQNIKIKEGNPTCFGYFRNYIGAFSLALGSSGCKYRGAPST